MTGMKQDKVFADGMICKRNANAPDWVVCNQSFKVNEFIEFLQRHDSNGWVNVQLKVAKSGDKIYGELDTWAPDKKQEHDQGMKQAKKALDNSVPVPDDFANDDIPF